MTETTTFDVHLASDVMSSTLETKLLSQGFTRDNFVGGTTGVVHPQHYSAHPSSLSEMAQLWEQSVAVLAACDPSTDFHGYAEAEVTPPRYRSRFEWKEFDETIRPPFGSLQYSPCPFGKSKDLDIHFTVDLDSVDCRLMAVMEDTLHFHYVDIERSPGRIVRVYTCQPLGLKTSPQLYWALRAYLSQAGGFSGKMKLEVTWAFARFPLFAPVCPVVLQMPELNPERNC